MRWWLLGVVTVAEWTRVLRQYARGNVTIYEGGSAQALSTSAFVRQPRTCAGVIYTAHDASRSVDRTLDEIRASWADVVGVCNFRVNIDIPLEVSGASMPPVPEKSWRRRTRNNPIILTDRYRAGLLLMAMIKKGLIVDPTPGKEPWLLYVDGDIAMVNVEATINGLVDKVEGAATQPTMEQRILGDIEVPAPRHVDVVFTHGDCMMLNSFSQSGSILFRASGLSGFLFEMLGQSPYYSIDVGDYRMGDQAIIDWVTESAFDMQWPRHNQFCVNYTHFEDGCAGKEFSYVRSFNSTRVRDHYFFQRYFNQWAPLLEPDHYLAWACGRWFNSPICKIRFREGSPFYFRCGDLLWHVYGCNKLERLYSKELRTLMSAPECRARLPPAAQDFFAQ